MTATTLAASYRSSEGKAANAYDRMRARIPREVAPSARVLTKKVGFKLGGIGFTYTAKDLEVSQEAPPLPSAATLAPSSYASTATDTPRRTLDPDNSLTARKRGNSAYTTQLRRQQEEAVPRSVLLSVV